MTKPTHRQIARLLATRSTPEPPANLADRIKAEIPDSIRLDRRTFQPGRRWLMPPLIEGLHPSWIAAASVLLVAGVGMVAARIPAQPDDVWKWMALSGVVHIDDIVVTAPAPAEPQGFAVAMAQPPASKGLRMSAPSRRKMPAAAGGAERADAPDSLAGEAAKVPFAPEPEKVAMVAAPPAGAPDLRVSDGREALPGSMSRGEIAADGAATRAMPIVAPSAPAAAANRSSRVQARAGVAEEENAVTVVILDEAGRPCEDVAVTLERLGQGATWTRTVRTDPGGTATFRGVPPSTYRALAAVPSIAPAQIVVTVASERTPTRAELRVRALPRR